jgi:integrase
MAEFTRVAEHLFIRKKTGRYYAIIKKNQRIKRHSLKTKIRSIADSRLFDFRLSLGTAPSQIARHKDIPTLSQAIADAVAIAKKRRDLKKMSPKTFIGIKGHLEKASEKLGHLRISQIRPAQIKEYLDSRELHCSGRTAQVDMTHLRRVFDLAKDRGWIWTNPLAQLNRYKANTKKVHVPTTDEIKKVLGYLRSSNCSTIDDGKKAADFIELLCLSGLRCQGAQTLRWENINFELGHLTVTEKGNKTREVDLFPALRAWLETRRKPKGLLFPKTHHLKRKKPSRFYPKKSLTTACSDCVEGGIRFFTFHACRHYFATQCLEAGISAPTVAGWLGHTDNGILVMKLYGNHMARKHFASEAQRVTINLANLCTPPPISPVSVNIAA